MLGSGVLVGFGRPPLFLVGVGENTGMKLPCVAVAVWVGVFVGAGVGVAGSSLHSPGPRRPRL